MRTKNWAGTIYHHLFTGIGLLGCIAPWATPRHFPAHDLPGQKSRLMILNLTRNDREIERFKNQSEAGQGEIFLKDLAQAADKKSAKIADCTIK